MSSNRTGGHSRKHSQTAGVFEPTLPSISTSNLATHVSMSQASPVQRELPASHIAAQAAVLNHQQAQQVSQHSRQRSQTVPPPNDSQENNLPATTKRTSSSLNPPVLSLTEASAPRETGFESQGYHNGLLGSNAAATAANMAFPRSGQTSPTTQLPPQPPPAPPLPEKKPEKSSKVKLFSRPGKIGVKAEPKDKPLPSPSKIGSALSALQRSNFSTTSLDTSAQNFYGVSNNSTATIRPTDILPTEKEGKEKKHYFLSRQRHKTKDKDDYHSQLSSAASNSRPTDPTAPSSLYNFNLPSSPGPNSSTFKNISGIDLRHGKARRDKDVSESVSSANAWSGPGSLGSINGPLYQEPLDSSKYGLNSMSYDDAWPYLRAKLLVIFEGEDLRLPVEDFNRVVSLHLEYCIRRRSPNQFLDDLRSLLGTGFSSLDQNLRKHSEDRLIPNLIDLWMHVFTAVLPYMQAVFLPLDQEFAGCGEFLKNTEQAKDFWGGVVAGSPPETSTGPINLAPATAVLDVRRLVLTAYRDVIIIPRYDKLKALFSRLSLEFLPSMALGSPLPESYLSTSPSAESAHSFPFQPRPGTAMSLDPSTGSYNSQTTTLLGDMAAGRSRGLSNVSFASSGAHSNGTDSLRPPKMTPGNTNMPTSLLGLSLREQNVEDSKYITDMVGRMLQCMSVLAGATGKGSPDEGTKLVKELGQLLKLNWLGRGRTGRNRRGIVGGRVARRAEGTATVREEISVS